VIAFDLGSDHRRLEQIMTPDELGRVRFVTGDITDLRACEATLDRETITNVIHLAALQVPFCRADPPRGALVNVVGTVNVFEAVRRRLDRMAPIAYTSSMGAYSSGDVDPATGRLRRMPSRIPPTITASTRWPTRGLRGSMRSRTACRASAFVR
jgi:nucleoside-diphosphate-sugar epimerase